MLQGALSSGIRPALTHPCSEPRLKCCAGSIGPPCLAQPREERATEAQGGTTPNAFSQGVGQMGLTLPSTTPPTPLLPSRRGWRRGPRGPPRGGWKGPALHGKQASLGSRSGTPGPRAASRADVGFLRLREGRGGRPRALQTRPRRGVPTPGPSPFAEGPTLPGGRKFSHAPRLRGLPGNTLVAHTAQGEDQPDISLHRNLLCG